MSRGGKRRRALELLKDVLIVALACSALWLSGRIHPLVRLGGLQGSEEMIPGLGQSQEGARAEAARPLRLSINQADGAGNLLRWGVEYDTDQSDALFQQVASILVEALSGAGAPEEITRAQWEQALQAVPGVVFDFQGTIPVPVLVGWLAGEETGLEGSVRRLALTIYENQTALYFRDESTGKYYRCLSAMAGTFTMAEDLGALGGNGAVYAFEEKAYALLDPDTLISQATPQPEVYAAANPVAGGQEDLETLMADLGLSVDNSSFYPAVDGQVARLGGDTLRLYDRGCAEFQAGDEGDERFQVGTGGSQATLFESVELCRQLTAAALNSRCGEARFFLSAVRQTEEGLEVVFQYCLDGAVVLLEDGYAARYLVRDGQIAQFWLNFRNYTSTGKTSVVMPVLQAVAAMEAKDLRGEELLLMYTDPGGDTASASWVAANGVLGRE